MREFAGGKLPSRSLTYAKTIRTVSLRDDEDARQMAFRPEAVALWQGEQDIFLLSLFGSFIRRTGSWRSNGVAEHVKIAVKIVESTR